MRLCNRAVVCDSKCSTESQSSFYFRAAVGITCTSSHALNNTLIWQLNSIITGPRENEGVQPPAALHTFLIPLSIFLLTMRINLIMRAENPSTHILRETAEQVPDWPRHFRTGWVVAVGISQTVEPFNTSPPWPVGLHCGVFYKEDHLDTFITLWLTVGQDWPVQYDGFVDQNHVCVFTLTVSTDFSKLAAVIGHGFSCQQASLSLLLSASDLNKPHTMH